MASVRDSFIRLCLKPSVECDLPGRLRLRFGRFEMLPSAALPYLHYIEDSPGFSPREKLPSRRQLLSLGIEPRQGR